jgi:hypothetical protein
MKTILLGGVMVSVLLIGGPAIAAGDDPSAFFALSNITAKGTRPLPQMSDEHLASIEGEGGAICIGCPNIAIVVQPNIAVQTLIALGKGISQSAIAAQGSRANVGQRLFR